jgi:UPF0042 nucleotide-binding protein
MCGVARFAELSRALEDLRDLSIPCRIVFLEASDEDLVRRFEATRRRHPLAPGDRVIEGIRKERLMMESLKGDADLSSTRRACRRTSSATGSDAFGRTPREQELQVSLVSFGFKHGLPRDADMVLDVRFLPNPHWVEALRPRPGTDPKVKAYVTGQKAYAEFMRRLRMLLDVAMPGYIAEGKSYLTVAVGCTGSRHRSVVVSEELGRVLPQARAAGHVEHRDVEHS